jgi:hypothetical protein
MGIYGLQSWGAYWARQLQREHEEELARLARWRGRLQAFHDVQLQWNNVVEVEAMACPGCERRYPFGSVCPVCEVELAGESYVHSLPPQAAHPPARPLRWLARQVILHALAFTVCIGLTTAFLFVDPQVAAAVYNSGEGQHRDYPAHGGAISMPQRMAYFDFDRRRGDVVPGLSVEMTVDTYDALELHLIAPGGEFGGEKDCHLRNCTFHEPALDWGRPGYYLDDPLMWSPRGRAVDQGIHVLVPSPGEYRVAVVPAAGASGATGRLTVAIHGRRVLDEELVHVDSARHPAYAVDPSTIGVRPL